MGSKNTLAVRWARKTNAGSSSVGHSSSCVVAAECVALLVGAGGGAASFSASVLFVFLFFFFFVLTLRHFLVRC